MPTSLAMYGMADQVVVAMTSLITKGRSEGPVDMVVLGEEGGMGDCPMGYELLRDAGSLADRMSGTSPPWTEGASNRKGKVAPYRERLCWKQDLPSRRDVWIVLGIGNCASSLLDHFSLAEVHARLTCYLLSKNINENYC